MKKRHLILSYSHCSEVIRIISKKIKTKRNFLISSFIVMAFICNASTYYVSTSGNDNSSGTQAAPFKTIQKAVNVVLSGDRIIIKPGTYGPVVIQKSGTLSQPITLMAEFPAISVSSSTALSKIKGNSLTGSGIKITNSSHWIIDGLEISGFFSGINLGNVNNITMRQNSFFENDGQGITCWQGNSLLVDHNQFIDRGDAYPASASAVMDYGVQLYWVTNADVTNNYFFGKFNHNISLKQNNTDTYIACNVFEGCMYQCIELGQNPDNESEGDKTSKDAIVEYNQFRDAVDSITGAYYRASMGVFISNINNATVRHNFFENFYNYPILVGYELFDGDHSFGIPVGGNTLVYGNTMVNPSTSSGSARIGVYVDTRQNNPLVKLYNNTFAGNYASCTGKDPGINLDEKNSLCKPAVSNFIGPISAYNPNTTRGPQPVFVPDWSRAKTYVLSSNSAYVDAGVNVGLAFTGSAPDIGSNEFIPSGPGCNSVATGIENSFVEPGPIVYPNPSGGIFLINYNEEEKELCLSVTDLLGRTIISKRLETVRVGYQLDLSHFPDGIYIIKLYTGDQIKTVKVVKKI